MLVKELSTHSVMSEVVSHQQPSEKMEDDRKTYKPLPFDIVNKYQVVEVIYDEKLSASKVSIAINTVTQKVSEIEPIKLLEF